MKKHNINFDDPLFKAEDDRLEAQFEYDREKRRRQEYMTGGW